MRNKTEIPHWTDLDNFLTSRFQSLETVSDIRNSEPIKSSDVPHENYTNSRNRVRSYSTKVANKSCVSCSKDHFLKVCPQFLNMNPEERFLVVKQHNLCINCLSDGHTLNTCQSNLVFSGSQATFVSEKLQRILNLPVKSVNAKTSGLNDTIAGSVQS